MAFWEDYARSSCIALEVRLVGVRGCADAGAIIWMMAYPAPHRAGMLATNIHSEYQKQTMKRPLSGRTRAHLPFQIHHPAVTRWRRAHSRSVVSCAFSLCSVITDEAVSLCAVHFHIVRSTASRSQRITELQRARGSRLAHPETRANKLIANHSVWTL
jgi:hypothetical protein